MYGQHPDRNQPVVNAEVQKKMVDTLENIILNASSQRSAMLNKLLDPRRNLNKECGYPETSELSPEAYRNLYDRESIATRVVQVEPKETWQVTPEVYEDEDPEASTEFEKAWDGLSKHLRGGNSFFKDEESSPIWEHLRRVDILSGIGHFGVLLLGLDDGQQLQFPVAGTPPDGFVKDITGQDAETKGDRNAKPMDTAYGNPVTAGTLGGSLGTDAQYFNSYNPGQAPEGRDGEPLHLIFLRAFDESLVQIVQYEASITNPRFGQPVMYLITLNDPLEQHSGVGLPLATVRVHWSRVIHVADNLGSSEIFGVPRMRPVFNRLLDLAKLYGGDAEMYWRAAFPGLSIETHPQLGGDVIIDQTGMRDMMDNYWNKLDRGITLTGMTAKSLAPQVVDPTPQITAAINAICIQLAIPLRIFMGSEQGKLAADQDSNTWNTKRVPERRKGYVTQRIIIPFIDRLILIGVLPEPTTKGKKPTEPVGNLRYGKLVKVVDTGEIGLLTNWAGFNEETLESSYSIRDVKGVTIVVNASELTPITHGGPGSGPRPGGGKGHSVKLPKKSSKLSIQTAASALDEMGYTLSNPKFDLKTKTSTYELTDGNGVKTRVSTEVIKHMVYEGQKPTTNAFEKVSTAGQSDEVLAEDDDTVDSTISQERDEAEEEAGYHIKWPDPEEMSAEVKSKVLLARVQAFVAYVSGSVESLIDPMDFLTRECGYSDEEAESMLENVQKHLEDSHPDTEDPIMPGHIPNPPTPELPPNGPIKMGQGETLFDADQGKVLHATPAPKKPIGNTELELDEDDFLNEFSSAVVEVEPIVLDSSNTSVVIKNNWEPFEDVEVFDHEGEEPTEEEIAALEGFTL